MASQAVAFAYPKAGSTLTIGSPYIISATYSGGIPGGGFVQKDACSSVHTLTLLSGSTTVLNLGSYTPSVWYGSGSGACYYADLTMDWTVPSTLAPGLYTLVDTRVITWCPASGGWCTFIHTNEGTTYSAGSTFTASVTITLAAASPLPSKSLPPTVCSSFGTYASAVLADNPWAYWRLNEPSGSVAHDCSGYGRDAAYQGGLALGAGGQGAGFLAATTAPVFDGSTGCVQLPTIPTSSFGGPLFGAFSIETWFAASSFANNVRIFDLSHGTESDWIVLFFGSASTQPYFLLNAGTNHYVFATAGPSLSLGAWNHVVLTQSASPTSGGGSYSYSVSVYVNGQQAATWTGSVSGYVDVARTVNYLGKSLYTPGDAFFSGTLAEAVRIALVGGPPFRDLVFSSVPSLAHRRPSGILRPHSRPFHTAPAPMLFLVPRPFTTTVSRPPGSRHTTRPAARSSPLPLPLHPVLPLARLPPHTTRLRQPPTRS